MADWLAARVRASPDATALIDAESGDQVTYTELDERATRGARGLLELGVGTGDHVGIVLGIDTATVALVHAVARLGAVLVALSPRLTGGELEARVKRADCDVLVCERETEGAASAVESGRVVSIDDPEHESVGQFGDRGKAGRGSRAGGRAAERAKEAAERPAIETAAGTGTDGGFPSGLGDPLVLLFTSGTTGRPKAVALTVGNVLASAGAAATRLGTLPDDRWLLALSPGGMGGLAPIYRSVLYGTALVLQGRFDPRETLETLSEYDCTGVSLVPTMLSRMLDGLGDEGESKENDRSPASDDGVTSIDGEGFPAGVRCVLLGGAPASRELIERCQVRGVPVHPTYGMTETASQVATARPAEAFSMPGTVGRPLVGVKVTTVADGEVLDPGKRGELVVSGPIVTPGYYGDAKSTQQAFSEHGFHTGDRGYVDENGRVFVTGRLDDRIVTGGETVDPEEVRVTLQAHPAVRDGAVVGLSDPEWGERVGALVVGEANESVSIEDLQAFCRERLAGYKLPRTIAIVDALPRTESGTVDRVAVVKRLRDGAEN